MKVNETKLESLEAVHTHTHTHTDSASGYLVRKKFEYVNKTQEKCIC